MTTLNMIDFIGYSGLVFNLLSMTMRNVFHLRLLALIANSIYIIYGLLLNAMPFIIGCIIAVTIHSYHIYKLHTNK